jgi:hypothetical protein
VSRAAGYILDIVTLDSECVELQPDRPSHVHRDSAVFTTVHHRVRTRLRNFARDVSAHFETTRPNARPYRHRNASGAERVEAGSQDR